MPDVLEQPITAADPNPAPEAPPPAPVPAAAVEGEAPSDELKKRIAASPMMQKIIEGQKKPEAKPEEPAPATPDPVKEKKADPAPKKVKKVADPSASAAAVAAETVLKIMDGRAERATPAQPAAAPEPQPELAELPEFVAQNAEVFAEMAVTNPRKYGSILKDFAKFQGVEQGYVKKWEKDNPGHRFDKEAADHDVFYDEHRPDYEDGDFSKAERVVLKREVTRDALREIQPQLDESRRFKTEQEIQPQIRSHVESAVVSIAGALSPDFADPKTGAEKLNEDPMALAVMNQVGTETVGMITEAIRLDKMAVEFNPQNPVHAQLETAVRKLEGVLQNLPREDRTLPDGRLFATMAQMAGMTPAQQRNYWIVDAPYLVEVLKATATDKAKKMYDSEVEKFNAYAKSRGLTPNGVAKVTAQPATNGKHTAPADPAPATPRTASPSLGGGPALGSEAPAKPKSTYGFIENWRKNATAIKS